MKLIDLKNINFPNKKDEEFRKIDLNTLLQYDFKYNNNYVIDLDTRKNNKDISTNNELYKINQNLNSLNYELVIKENTKKPIIIIHNLKQDDILYTNTLDIKVEKNIEASIIEVFLSNCTNTLYSLNRSFELEKNSKLQYFKYQDIKQTNSLITNTILNLKTSSSIEYTNYEIGDGFNLNIYETVLNKQKVNLNINALVRLYKNSTSASIFNTIHNAKHCLSSINYKHSLHENSKAIFEAKTLVNNSANFSKVLQNSNTILLSDDATIFAKPHLEISIDELEASHSATTGSLNQEELLYLCSRGIPKTKAYNMLLKAFENEIFDNIQDKKIQDFIKNFKRSDYV